MEDILLLIPSAANGEAVVSSQEGVNKNRKRLSKMRLPSPCEPGQDRSLYISQGASHRTPL